MTQYTIKPGDTLYQIAKRYGITLAQLLAANPQIASPYIIYVGQVINIPVTQPAPNVYIVRPGDTMSAIAARFGVPLDILLAANPQVTNPSLIYPGLQLLIPPQGTQVYVVKPGDTLNYIVQAFNTTLETILKLNPGITNPALIYVGQKIFVPISTTVIAPGCITYVSDRTGYPQIWKSDAEGKRPVQLTGRTGLPLTLAAEPSPKWSYDGMYIAFLGQQGGNTPIFVIGNCGENPQSPVDDAANFVWSPSSTRLLYSNQSGTFISDLQGRSTLVSNRLFNPDWLPGENAVVGYTTVEGLNYTVLARVDVNGQNFRVFDNPPVAATEADVSPNGRYALIQFFSGSAFSLDGTVSVYDFNTERIVRLPGKEIQAPSGAAWNVSFIGSWSKDSSRFVYTTFTSAQGATEIRVASPDGRILAAFPAGYYARAKWGPIAEWVVCSASGTPGTSLLEVTKPRNIYLLNVNTGESYQVTTRGDNYHPDWNPRPCRACR